MMDLKIIKKGTQGACIMQITDVLYSETEERRCLRDTIWTIQKRRADGFNLKTQFKPRSKHFSSRL
jgi:hypothetical protein